MMNDPLLHCKVPGSSLGRPCSLFFFGEQDWWEACLLGAVVVRSQGRWCFHAPETLYRSRSWGGCGFTVLRGEGPVTEWMTREHGALQSRPLAGQALSSPAWPHRIPSALCSYRSCGDLLMWQEILRPGVLYQRRLPRASEVEGVGSRAPQAMSSAKTHIKGLFRSALSSDICRPGRWHPGGGGRGTSWSLSIRWDRTQSRPRSPGTSRGCVLLPLAHDTWCYQTGTTLFLLLP